MDLTVPAVTPHEAEGCVIHVGEGFNPSPLEIRTESFQLR